MNIYAAFENTAQKYSDTIALIEGKQKISYGELLSEINAEAKRFRNKGIDKGDRVLVFVPMGIDLYRTVLAIFKIGATAVFLDEWTSLERLRLCCRLADCKAIIGGRKLLAASYFFKETRQVPLRIRPKKSEAAEVSTCSVNEEHPALITFTTGSTGIPKAALRSHGFLAAQREALKEEVNPKSGEPVMTTLPVILLLNLAAGATSVIAEVNQRKPEKMQPQRIFKQLQEHKIKQVIASPFFVKTLAENEEQSNFTLSIDKILTGGAPVFPKDAELFMRAFPKAEIFIAYGSTEAEPISIIQAEQLAQAEEKAKNYGVPVGKIHSGTDLKIIRITDENMNADIQPLQEVAPGEIGEIAVAGEHVLRSYFKNEKAWLRNKIQDGEKLWHRTGDAGRMGADGVLYLTGRCASYYTLGQDTYSPFLTEYALKQHPDIEEGTPVVRQGKSVFCISLKDKTKQEEVKDFIMKNYPAAELVRFFRDLPKDPRHHSKIDYAKL